jgi:hypothetical protein
MLTQPYFYLGGRNNDQVLCIMTNIIPQAKRSSLILKTYELIYPYELDVDADDPMNFDKNQVWCNFMLTVPRVELGVHGACTYYIDPILRQYSAVYFGSHIKFKHEEDMTLFLLRFS